MYVPKTKGNGSISELHYWNMEALFSLGIHLFRFIINGIMLRLSLIILCEAQVSLTTVCVLPLHTSCAGVEREKVWPRTQQFVFYIYFRST